MPLTDTAIKALKPADKPFKKSDGGGLYVWMTPNGTRTWRMDYRFLGKGKTLTIGQYPGISLADARRRRDEAKLLIADGIDPSSQKKLEKLQAKVAHDNTFAALAEEHFERLEKQGRAEATLKKHRWYLSFALPDLGHRPITGVSSAEILGVLRTVEASGRLETAARLRSTIGSVFRFAIATARADQDPTVALQRALIPPTVQSRAAITNPVELGGLLRSIDSFEGQPATRAALKLLPLVFSRPGELRMAIWEEFDLDAGVWVIPAARTKTRKEHKKPLAQQTVQILKDLHPITGDHPLIFPSIRTWQKPISDNTLNAALRRLGYRKDEVTAHGFRATASTLLNESGKWNPDAIERELGHVEHNKVRSAYHRSQYWDERKEMVQWWADKCDALRDGADIVQLFR